MNDRVAVGQSLGHETNTVRDLLWGLAVVQLGLGVQQVAVVTAQIEALGDLRCIQVLGATGPELSLAGLPSLLLDTGGLSLSLLGDTLLLLLVQGLLNGLLQ